VSQSLDLSAIIGDLYAGVLDEAAWSRSISAIIDGVGATCAHLLCVHPTTGAVFRDEAHRIDPGLATAYRDYFSSKDILRAPILTAALGEPTPDYKLVPLRDWEQSEIFNDLAIPYETPYVLPTLLHNDSNRIVVLSLRTSLQHGPFHMHEAAALKAVIPHVRRALEIRDRIALSEVRVDALANSLVNNVSFGVMLLDAMGHILEANSVAEQLIKTEPGVRRNADKTLSLREPAGTDLYRWIIAGTPPTNSHNGLLHVHRSNASPISVLVTPLPSTASSWLGHDPRWVLLLFDPDRRIHASKELIAQDMGISEREAEIAALLVAGYDLRAISTMLNISVHTARTHLKAIFSKTGICSQAELIRRITSGPSAIARTSR
jgi:DNA-binding CsgD family transcriptional regulator